MIDIYDKAPNRLVGSITEADYADTIDVVADGRASDHLVKVLRDALGDREGVDIRWERWFCGEANRMMGLAGMEKIGIVGRARDTPQSSNTEPKEQQAV